jgi:predicted SprT family Zn-dependent metalloprotease
MMPERSGSYDPTHATTAQSTAFESICAYFATALFDEALPATILTFDRKVSLPSTFHPDRWSPRKGGARLSEISLNPDLVCDLTRQGFGMTICHELVHLWQHVHGAMRSRATYHNLEWSEKMHSIGLVPSDTGQPGGARVGERMSQYALRTGRFAKVFARMDRSLALPFLERSRPRGPAIDRSKSKFVCVRCGDVAWGKATLAIDCRKCGRSGDPCSFVLEKGG